MANKSDLSLLIFKDLVIAGNKSAVPKASTDPLLGPIVSSLSDHHLGNLHADWNKNELLPIFKQILESPDPVQAASQNATPTGLALSSLPDHNLSQLKQIWENSSLGCPSGITKKDV